MCIDFLDVANSSELDETEPEEFRESDSPPPTIQPVRSEKKNTIAKNPLFLIINREIFMSSPYINLEAYLPESIEEHLGTQ